MIHLIVFMWLMILVFMAGMCFICSFDPYPHVWKKLNAIEVATLSTFLVGVLGFSIKWAIS